MKSKLKAFLPAPLWAVLHSGHRWVMRNDALRTALYDAADGAEWLLGLREPLSPPRKLIHGIGRDLEVGRSFLKHFQQLGNLQPGDWVLDVGCGVGRMAIPLTGYITTEGSYEGFDIMRPNIVWCRRAITSRFPHFRFQHANIFNTEYNSRGRVTACEFRFPYAESSFDFVFLTSVFTHLLAAEIEHYLAEIARVLRPGGRCLATFFLLNEESIQLNNTQKSPIPLKPYEGPIWVTDSNVPEACVAVDEKFVHEASERHSLQLETTHPGCWCGRTAFTDFQDIVLFRSRT